MLLKSCKAIFGLAALFICVSINCYGQNTTNKGTEFWTAYMDHVDASTGRNASQMDLYITSDVSTTGTVTVADGSFTTNFSVAANGVTTLSMPSSAFLNGPDRYKKGIHIVTAKPVAIYAHIFAEAASGATLLLPVSTLGRDYYSINYTQASNSVDNNGKPSYSVFLVIATDDNTTVEITPSRYLVGGAPANTPFNVTLSKGEVYQFESVDDLTGSRIRTISGSSGTCKKIAVFSGSTKIAIGCGDNTVGSASSDNLFQQVYPTAAWGKNYITVPLANRNYDIFRIVASQPNTNVTLNGVPVNVSSGYYEYPSTTPDVIVADKPVQVVQYAVTQGRTENCVFNNDDLGDPEMIYLTPVEQTIDHVTLYSTSNYKILRNYINVLIKTEAVSTFTLDGVPYTTFKPVLNAPGYSYAQIPVLSTSHAIRAAEGFNAIAYGFGVDESYGYAAGTNLQDLTEYVALDDPLTNTEYKNGCSDVSYKFQMTLPFQTSNIVWKLSDGSAPYTDSNPVPVATPVKDGKTLYVYQYIKAVRFQPGDYSMVASVFDPLADDCGKTDNVELDFNISDFPVADFSFVNTCFGEKTLFTDKTDVKGNSVKTWLWDFGDGQTSALQNPDHQYSQPGKYNVTLTVNNENGCSSSPKTYQLEIIKKPIASFTNSNPDCAGQPVTFIDHSTTANGNITKWLWNFGDGTDVVTRTDNQPFQHVFATDGQFQVTLNAMSESGCSSDPFPQTITVLPAAKVDFDVPVICTSDPNPQFIDRTTVNGAAASGCTYSWDFGDPNATAANPNSSASQSPYHAYTQARFSDNPYHVTLTVTTPGGCVYSVTKNVIVNDMSPAAGFAVEGSANICAGDIVTFDDQSTTTGGNQVGKVVWYFNSTDNPATSVTYQGSDIPADGKYHFQYDKFTSPLTKTINVRMIAYTGETCFTEYDQQITIHASPVVTLTMPDAVCANDQPFKIAVDAGEFDGTSVFSGQGLSADGTFSPQAAGAGVATINYTFTSIYNCVYTTTKQINVNALPQLTLPSAITMLEGKQYTLKAVAQGDGLTYKWSPSAGLDHDDVLNPVVTPAENIQYTLIVTNASGCKVSAAINVTVLKLLQIPNAFTPNGDGINDIWNIKYLNTYPNNTVDIYNRYGEKVYSSVGYAVPWDGKFNGSYLPMGAYYYIINPKNGRDIVSGNVTIIR